MDVELTEDPTHGNTLRVKGGREVGITPSSAVLKNAVMDALSGIGIALQPKQAAGALDLSTSSARGVAETRIGLGGTYAALGLWALARGSTDAYTAVGMTLTAPCG